MSRTSNIPENNICLPRTWSYIYVYMYLCYISRSWCRRFSRSVRTRFMLFFEDPACSQIFLAWRMHSSSQPLSICQAEAVQWCLWLLLCVDDAASLFTALVPRSPPSRRGVDGATPAPSTSNQSHSMCRFSSQAWLSCHAVARFCPCRYMVYTWLRANFIPNAGTWAPRSHGPSQP